MLTNNEQLHTTHAANWLAEVCHRQAFNAGWWNDYNSTPPEYRKYILATHIALQHSELSEALEGLRKGKPDDHLPEHDAFEVELADLLIRVLDTCGMLAAERGYNIGLTMVEKLVYNAQRADHKPENRAAPGGKSF